MTFKSLILSAIFAPVLCIGVAGTSAAQDTDAILQALDEALPGTLIHNPLDLQWETGGNDLKSKIVKAPALTSGKAVSVKIKKRQDKPWDSYLKTDISGAVEKGETIEVYYWVRTAQAVKGKDLADITLFLGRNHEPYDNIFAERISPSTTWELKSVKGVAASNFSDGEIKAEYQLGRGAQIVEFGPIYVSKLETP